MEDSHTDILNQLRGILSYQDEQKEDHLSDTDSVISLSSTKEPASMSQTSPSAFQSRIPGLDLVPIEVFDAEMKAKKRAAPSPAKGPSKKKTSGPPAHPVSAAAPAAPAAAPPPPARKAGEASAHLNHLLNIKRLVAEWNYEEIYAQHFVATVQLVSTASSNTIFESSFDETVDVPSTSKKAAKEVAAEQAIQFLSDESARSHSGASRDMADEQLRGEIQSSTTAANKLSPSKPVTSPGAALTNPNADTEPKTSNNTTAPPNPNVPANANTIADPNTTQHAHASDTSHPMNWIGILHEHCQRTARPPPDFTYAVTTTMQFYCTVTVFCPARIAASYGDANSQQPQVFGAWLGPFATKKAAKQEAARAAVLGVSGAVRDERLDGLRRVAGVDSSAYSGGGGGGI